MRWERDTGKAEGIAIFIANDEPIGARIVYVNDAFVRMTGVAAEQLVGHSALLLAGARPNLAHIRAATEAPRNRPYVAVERKARPDGSYYDAEVRLEALPSARGGPTHLVLTQRALTLR